MIEDINLILSFNNTNDFQMNCVISMNNSSLYCSFNKSNLKTDSYINIYSIKENEINANDKNIFLVGLNKVEFIYETEEEKEEKIKTEGIKLFIIIIIIVVSIIILVSLFVITIFIIRKKKKEIALKSKSAKAEESKFSHNKIGMNGSSKDNLEIKK